MIQSCQPDHRSPDEAFPWWRREQSALWSSPCTPYTRTARCSPWTWKTRGICKKNVIVWNGIAFHQEQVGVKQQLTEWQSTYPFKWERYDKLMIVSPMPRGTRKILKENLKVVRAKFSTLRCFLNTRDGGLVISLSNAILKLKISYLLTSTSHWGRQAFIVIMLQSQSEERRHDIQHYSIQNNNKNAILGIALCWKSIMLSAALSK